MPAARRAVACRCPRTGPTYIVVAAVRGSSGHRHGRAVRIGSLNAAPQQDVSPDLASGNRPCAHRSADHRVRGLQQSFDYMLRQKERAIARGARAGTRRGRSASVDPAAPPPLGSHAHLPGVRRTSSCGTFKTDTAIAQYVGTQDRDLRRASGRRRADSPPGDIAAMGTPSIRTSTRSTCDAFGAPSDLDANGIVIVLMTPNVNEITPSSAVRDARLHRRLLLRQRPHDTGAKSNSGEIFYSLVPDPPGTLQLRRTRRCERRADRARRRSSTSSST